MRRKTGYSLLEVMLAVGLFALAGIASTRAIAEIGTIVVMVQREDFLRERMRSYLDELKTIRLTPGSFTINEDDQGFAFQVDVSVFEAVNEEGENLQGLFEVEVEMTYTGQGRNDTQEAKFILYQP
ncbi:MAG: hypothetical protein AAFY98_03075 [Verrucomicrobiota bacterium]